MEDTSGPSKKAKSTTKTTNKSTSKKTKTASNKYTSKPSGSSVSVWTEEEDTHRLRREGISTVTTCDEEGNITDVQSLDSDGEEIEEDDEEPAEDDEAELSMSLYLEHWERLTDGITERMNAGWRTCIYTFFDPVPDIEYCNGRKCHVFKCSAKNCKHKIARFIHTSDAQSTGNMRKHVRKCWGEDVLKAADEAKNVAEARAKVIAPYIENGS